MWYDCVKLKGKFAMENTLAYFALQDKRKKVLQPWRPGCAVEMRKCGIIVLNLVAGHKSRG